jgi:hypothetical protein
MIILVGHGRDRVLNACPPVNTRFATRQSPPNDVGPRRGPLEPSENDGSLTRCRSTRGCPRVKLPFGLITCDPVAFLDLADELLRATLDLIQIIIGQLSPLLTNLSLELCPLTLQSVLVHAVLQCTAERCREGSSTLHAQWRVDATEAIGRRRVVPISSYRADPRWTPKDGGGGVAYRRGVLLEAGDVSRAPGTTQSGRALGDCALERRCQTDRLACNGVQGATAFLAFSAALATLDL